jgi:phosphate transport system permease protein
VLPAAIPGIATGSILALSRAIGETAPLLLLGALTFITFNPEGLNSPFTVLPIQIFGWTTRPQEDFKVLAAAAIVVLLVLLLTMNAFAIWLRNRYQRKW